ncbi:hypothetical protein [Streptomyces sp. NPDC088725]|uniref:hypothetical protein n=1 Tax=Streptomyces sp. NPDC088725 TaxID=3365873 RepID=UPI00382B1C45
MAGADSVALARNLINTEYGLRGGRFGRRAASRGTDSAWTGLAAELSRLLDRLRGRSPSPSQSASTAAPGTEDGPQQPVPVGRADFEGAVSRLPEHEREAFEDAVLAQLRSGTKWRKAYDKSPASMPTVAEYANNAFMRELRRGAPEERRTDRTRERWERTATTRAVSSQDTPAHGSQGPGEGDFTDGQNFEAAERRNLAARTAATASTPRRDDLTDGHTFLAAERREVFGSSASASASVSPPPSPVSPPGSPESPTGSFDFPHPLLSSEGRAIVRESYDSPSGPSTPRFSDASSSLVGRKPVRPNSHGQARR